ncbi:uncharacterized protein LOC111268571 [Varroa jacobsoni]|uniref:Uncharacterized protein n=1 Tax=Varroa destructor TaxID=109461 RepID=A0A7M7J5L5_VARDE|nr:uncharacterized protein LOC111244229 isoform X2 [Varroa destructor]XP_022703370.1 uncharacterized protein LOC111268571 [Varroa jacobsoni]
MEFNAVHLAAVLSAIFSLCCAQIYLGGNYDYDPRCHISQTVQGEWYSRERGDDTFTTIEQETIRFNAYDQNTQRNLVINTRCINLTIYNNDNYTFVLQRTDTHVPCYYCTRMFVRTLNVIDKISTPCVNINPTERPDVQTVCRNLDVNMEQITLFSTNPTPKNCRSSLEGVWKFAYKNTYRFSGECKHPDANITACQVPGSQFFIDNQQFQVNYRQCEGMEDTEEGEVQFKCLGDWYIGKNHFFAVVNSRESRIDEKYRCFLANRDDDTFLGASITPECNVLKNPQDAPSRYHMEQVKTEIMEPRCKLPENFTGEWINTANFDADVIINRTHIIERWKPDTGRIKEQVYVCVEKRNNRYMMARHGINGCQRDYVCFDFVPRHHSVIRYRKGKELRDPTFSTVCSWTMFRAQQDWRYDLLVMKNPVSIKCPVAGKFKFQQHGDILFETRIRGGVTQMPRPNVYCKENISDFSVCDRDQRTIAVDADYCVSVDHFGRPVDIYSEPDHMLKCIGFWRENLKSYLITYEEEDAYSKYRCWVYQRADLNRILMSLSVGAFCHVKQDVVSISSREGAQVALDMVEYEREHDDCPMYFDDGTNPYAEISEQAATFDAATFNGASEVPHCSLAVLLSIVWLIIGHICRHLY